MGRNLRSKASSTQATEEPASDPPDTSKRSLRSRQAESTKEKKGNGQKSTENVILTLKSPVLRDRTNLITELPNIDLLKKGVDEARVKPATRRTRIPSKTNDSKPKNDEKPPPITRAVRKVQKKEVVEPKPVEEPPQKPPTKKSNLSKVSEATKGKKSPLPPAESSQRKRSLRISQQTDAKEETDKKSVNSKLKTPVAVPATAKPTGTKTKKAVTVSTTSRLKQTTLKESLSKAKPPKQSKNSEEPSKTSKSISPAKNPESTEKKPVYKSIKDSDTVENDSEDPYNFDYDKNDSQERIVPKKRKKPVRRAPVKRQKTVAKPLKVATKPLEIKKPLPPVEIQSQVVGSPPEPPANVVVTVAEVYDAPGSPEPFTLPKKIGQKHTAAPRIISDEILDQEHQINLSAIEPIEESADDLEDFGPWRATNVFSTRPPVQFKSMIDHSLLQQTISPIRREVVPEFDVGSPWRPNLPLEAFSRVRNVVQSTPQSKKLSEKPPIKDRHTMPAINENNDENPDKSVVKSPAKVAQPLEEVESPQKSPVKVAQSLEEVESPQKSPVKVPRRSEETESPQKSPVKIVRRSEEAKSSRKSPLKKFNSSYSPQKSPRSPLVSPRKFGTEISNLSDPRTSNSPRKFGNDLSNTSSASNSPRKFGNNSSNTSAGNKPSPLVVRAVNLPEMSANEKENSAPNCQSPEMSPNHIRSPSISPLTPLKDRMAVRVVEPQPGPSGLYKSPTRLKQSNLNSFLKLPPMPESTRISTADGIFDDVHSTPITASVGAETSCLDIGVSPISSRVLRAEKVPENDPAAKPVRYSVGQMRRALTTQIDEAVQVDLKTKNQVDNPDKQIAEFSDVFDCGDEQVEEGNLEECRLFMDLEPTHFKEPPKFSYKRKRTQSLNSSGEMDSDTDDDDDEVAVRRKRAPKKKRMGKVQREQNQRINEWAKNLNETFEEIDHFDLIVEPVHEKK